LKNQKGKSSLLGSGGGGAGVAFGGGAEAFGGEASADDSS